MGAFTELIIARSTVTATRGGGQRPGCPDASSGRTSPFLQKAMDGSP